MRSVVARVGSPGRIESHSERRTTGGFTTVELSMTIAILGMVIGAFYGAYNGFLRDVAFAERLGGIERETRPVVNALVIELRQATPPNSAANGQAIEFLASDKIIFYADRRPMNGPEQFAYERMNCVDGLCDLVLSMRFAEAASAYPNFTYSTAGAGDFVVTVLQRVPDTVQLFQGIQLDGIVETEIDDCDRLDSLGAGIVPCRFDMVRLNVEVAPNGSGTVPSNYVVTEDVQLRNVGF